MKNSIIQLAAAAAISFTFINCSGDSKNSTTAKSLVNDITEQVSSYNAVEFNNSIMMAINNIQTDQIAMNNAMASEDYTKAGDIRATWSKNLDAAIDKISKTEPSGDGVEFKNAVLKNLESYKSIVNDQYVKLIEIRKNNGDTNEDTALLDEINNGLESVQNNINDAADIFQTKVNAGTE
ncbi:LIC11966 family surface protein [Chryseobacterium sp. CT-SW4]|uniref:LIC11966 family surface protein n=1 Tax=Chryseobacterium sp. SW-1 TaxID=3157343 RepID=UPI003B01D5D3